MLPHISVSSSKTSLLWADFHVNPSQGSCPSVWEPQLGGHGGSRVSLKECVALVQSALVLSTDVSLAVSPVLAGTSWSLGRNAQPGEVILLHREQDLALSACQAAAPVWLTWTCAGPGRLSNTKAAAAPALPSPSWEPPPFSTEHLQVLCPGCAAGGGAAVPLTPFLSPPQVREQPR